MIRTLKTSRQGSKAIHQADDRRLGGDRRLAVLRRLRGECRPAENRAVKPARVLHELCDIRGHFCLKLHWVLRVTYSRF